MREGLIFKDAAVEAIDARLSETLTGRGFDSYEHADGITKIFCDGLMEAMDAVLGMDAAYICDADANTGCKKTSCYKNGGPCHMTTREEYAQ